MKSSRSTAGSLGLVFFLVVTLGFLCLEPVAKAEGGLQVEATMCKSVTGEDEPVGPTTQFAKDVTEIFATWKSDQTKEGQISKAVWIAIDVGKAAPPNTKIVEKSIKLERQPDAKGKDLKWWHGNFSLTKPTAGWPIGTYRLEIYFDDKLTKTLPFTIQ